MEKLLLIFDKMKNNERGNIRRKSKDNPKVFSFVMSCLRPIHKFLYLIMFFLVLVNPLLELISNATLSKILDSANLREYDDFILFIIIQAIIYFVIHIISYLIETSKAKLINNSKYNMKEKLFDKLLNGDLSELNKSKKEK